MNIYLNSTIFIFLFCLYLIVYKFHNKSKFDLQANNVSFLLELDKFYVDNKTYLCFSIFIYLFFHSLIFFFLRISMLGVTANLPFFYNNFSPVTMINLILFILNISFYLQILDMLFSPYLISLHFYLHKNAWYIKINDLQRDHSAFISGIFLMLGNLCANLIYNVPESFIHKYKIVLYFYIKAKDFFYWLNLYLSRFLSYNSFSLIIISLVYDIYCGVFFYIYYILFFHFIARFINKVRTFIYVKDCVLDPSISDYFYKNNPSYIEIRRKLSLNPTKAYLYSSSFGEHVNFILQSEDEIKHYIKNNFQVDYIVARKIDENILLSRARRLNVLFLLVLSNIFYFYNSNKFNVILFDSLKVQLIYLLLPLLLLSFVYEKASLYSHNKEEIKLTTRRRTENKGYKYIFIALSIIQGIVILYIMLINKVLIIPNEVLFDHFYIKIIQTFSIEEKIAYMEKYFTFKLQKQDDIMFWMALKDNIINKMKMNINAMSMEEVRKIVEAIINSWSNEDINQYLTQTIQNRPKWWQWWKK